MRKLSILALGTLALLVAGCATLRENLDCSKAPSVRRAAEVTMQVIDARCPLPAEPQSPPSAKPGEQPLPPTEPNVQPR